jgi:peptidoglycan hydrolase-like protein with peptidoglycan-binding domain
MLQASVGQGGENRPDDVRLVQTLLNARRPTGFPLGVDGICGLSTITAIRRFQGQTLGLKSPDGRVEPGSITLRALAPVAPRVPSAIPREPIPEPIVAAAQAAQRQFGVPACISIAQWILESDRGAHMPPGSNNPFGMKAACGEPYVIARTREVHDGETIMLDARFRKFATLADAFTAHGRLLANFAPYRAAMQAADPDEFAAKLTGTYATDPNYGAALQSIMRGSNLYQFDLAPVPQSKKELLF